MLQKILEKIFGSRKSEEKIQLAEPSSRYIEPSEFNSAFGRNCAPGGTLVSAAPTPETAQTQYCRA